MPPVPPKPPKRGILKGPRVNVTRGDSGVGTTTISTDSHALLIKNTLQNELITYENVRSRPVDSLDEVNFTHLPNTNNIKPNQHDK